MIRGVLLVIMSLVISFPLAAQQLFGVTYNGGSTGNGVLFEFNTATDIYTKRWNFTTTSGTQPISSLILANGKLYGVTAAGGLYGGGVIYSWDPATQTYTTEFNFVPANGSQPEACFTLYNGKFYGVTSQGGLFSLGVVYEWDPITKVYAKRFDLDNNTGRVAGGNMIAQAGRLYGVMSGGGSFSNGVLYEWNPTIHTYTKLHDFNGTSGSRPTGMLAVWNGQFYGTTQMGGINDVGVIYQWDPSSQIYTKKIDFSDSRGTGPYCSLTLYNNHFYGFTSGGGRWSAGVLFQWDPLTNSYDNQVELEYFYGAFPLYNDLMINGTSLWGLTYGGGSTGGGALFQWEPAPNTYTKKADFGGAAIGSNPYGRLTYYSATVLPLQFTKVEAMWKNETPVIKWCMEDSEEAEHYNIECSKDGLAFTTVGSCKAYPQLSCYQFIDSSAVDKPSSIKYYRVKAFKKNLQTIYSVILPLKSEASLKLWAELEGETIVVSITLPKSAPLQWELLDASGRKLKLGATQVNKGENKLYLSGFTKEKGLYFLKIAVDATIQTLAVMK